MKGKEEVTTMKLELKSNLEIGMITNMLLAELKDVDATISRYKDYDSETAREIVRINSERRNAIAGLLKQLYYDV